MMAWKVRWTCSIFKSRGLFESDFPRSLAHLFHFRMKANWSLRRNNTLESSLIPSNLCEKIFQFFFFFFFFFLKKHEQKLTDIWFGVTCGNIP